MALSRIAVDWSRPPVARVTLRSRSTRNRLDERVLVELTAALDEAEATPGVRVFVLDSVGETFCAGLALDELASAWRARIAAVSRLLTRLTASHLITVALVDGAALGGGVGLAAACDQVVIGQHATFRMTEVVLGLIPAAILPVVARRVGGHRAYGLALTVRELSGPEAVEVGLADRQGGEGGLRRILAALRAADPAALVALKRYYSELTPAPAQQEERVIEALGRRLAGPHVHRRLADLREQGLIT